MSSFSGTLSFDSFPPVCSIGSKLFKLDPSGAKLAEYTVPGSKSFSASLLLDEVNGLLWFTASQLVAAVSMADLTPVRSATSAAFPFTSGDALSPDGATLYFMGESEFTPARSSCSERTLAF